MVLIAESINLSSLLDGVEKGNDWSLLFIMVVALIVALGCSYRINWGKVMKSIIGGVKSVKMS